MLVSIERRMCAGFAVVVGIRLFLLWRAGPSPIEPLTLVLQVIMVASLAAVTISVSRIHRARQQTTRVLETITDGFFSLDTEYKFTYINGAAEKIMAKSRDQLLGTCVWEAYPEAVGSEYQRQYERAVADRCATIFEAYYPKSDAWFEFRAHPTPEGIGVYFHDITEEKRVWEQRDRDGRQMQELTQILARANALLEAQKRELETANVRLTALAMTDGLTGLKNHRAFQERLREEVDRARRTDSPLSVLVVDVDNFKAYNDAFGHPAGDAVLQKVGATLEHCVRGTDTVARYGGEEFAIILPGDGVKRVRKSAERLRAAIETTAWQDRPITVSIGIATWTDAMADASLLVQQADKALYRSKQNGRNCATHIVDPVAPFQRNEENMKPYTDMVRGLLDLQEDTLIGAADSIQNSMLQSYDATVKSWSKILDLRDKETDGHSERVTDIMVRLARRLGMTEDEILYAKWGAQLHDIGKMGIPDSILLKQDALTEEEWTVMKRHPVIAYEMLSDIAFLGPALDIPHFHHEKWNGTGYPNGLVANEIPLTARLFAVIDVYDALSSDRPYRKAWTEERVWKHLQDQAGTHFEPRAVEVFLEMLEDERTAYHRPLKRAA